MEKKFIPEKYGMMFCTECEGKGKIGTKTEGFNVCSKCGGNGVLKKVEKTSKVERE